MAGLNRNGWISDHSHISQKIKTEEISHPQKWDRWPGDNWQPEGWGTQHSFCLSFYWQLLFPHLLRPWISRLGEWRVQAWLWVHCAAPTPSFALVPALLLSKVIFFWPMINCPGCVPFQFLCYPQSPDWGREKALAVCIALLSNRQNTSVVSMLF